MFTKLSINKDYLADKNILFAIVDQTGLRDKHKEMHDFMYNVTNNFTTRMALTTLYGKVQYFESIDAAMNNSSDYDIVVIQNIGNIIRINYFYELLNQYCKENPDFFMLAFTLDWESEKGDGWLEIHHQMMIVNAKTWENLGKPTFGEWETTVDLLPDYDRSVENFHDKYTPYWIKGLDTKTEKLRKYQGWNFLKTALNKGVKIDNFSQAMRDCRLYTYPEHESDNFFRGIKELDSKKVDNSNQKKFINNWLQSKPQIWIFNSEHNIFDVNVYGHDYYFGPAAGFKYLSMLRANENINFVIYDYNQESIDWIRNLWENWDGENLETFIKKQPLELKRKFKYINETVENNIDIMHEDFGGLEAFKTFWIRFKNSNVRFVKLDIIDDLEDLEKIIHEISPNKPFFYYSNIFSTDMLSVRYSMDEIKQKHECFLNILHNSDINMTSYGCKEDSEWLYKSSKRVIKKMYGDK